MSEEIQVTSKKKSTFKPNEYEYVHPETMKEVPFKSLPKPYREMLESTKRAQDYKKSESEEINPSAPVYKNKEQKALMETTDGKRLAVYLRPATRGGCVDKKGKLVFKKDERYDPNKSWKYPYGKQLVEIKKQKSHEFGKTKWKLVYTEEYKVVHGAVKFEAVRQLADNIDEAKRRWTNDMLSTDVEKSLCAIMCAMSNESPFRSGNTSSATRAKNKTFGITTLKVKHLNFIEGKNGEPWVRIHFQGKGGESIEKIIKNKIVVAKLRGLVKGKDSSDYVFTDKQGKLVDAGILNKYCRSLGIPKYHMFRHIRASQAFKEASDKLIEGGYVPDMPTSTEILKLIKIAADESAKLLGNTGAVCIEKYIAPQLMFDVFKRYDLPVAPIIKNLAKMPSTVTQKDIEKMLYDSYQKNIEDIDEDDDEADASALEEIGTKVEQYVTFANFDNIPNPLINRNDTTFEEDEEAREKFEEYVLTYEHDDEDIINNPDDMVLSTFLVPVDWTPDFSLMEEFMRDRPDQYKVEKDTDYDPRSNYQGDVTNWGYNDFNNITPEEFNKKMMDDAQRDIDRLTKELNNDSSV